MRSLSEITNGLVGTFHYLTTGESAIDIEDMIACVNEAIDVLGRLENIPSAEPIDGEYRPFWVLDKTTGKEADPHEIALKEEWAQDLIYCDMEGFAILEDGSLYLLDECGNYVYCNPVRFEVRWVGDPEY